MSLPIYNCPVQDCSRQFDRTERKGDNCPCGRVKLKYKRYKEGGRLLGKYILAEEPGDEPNLNGSGVLDFSKDTEVPKLPLLLSGEREIPAIYLTGVGREDGKFKEYTIEITGILHNGKVHCPNCEREVTDNSFGSQPIYLDQEVQCSRSTCRAKITILYRANPTLLRY